jgi:hypothetical protein
VIGKYRLITLLREPVSRLLSDFNHLSHYHRTMTFSQYLESHHEPNHQSRWLGFDGRDPDFIRKRFSAVGITERFDESMLLFRHCLGLSLEDVLYVRQRSDVDKRLRLSDLGQEAIDELKDINWLDVKLYEQANATFDRYLDDVPEMSKELEVYRSALNDFRHPLWSRRGTFPIGYTARYVWSEFDSEHARVRDLREVVAGADLAHTLTRMRTKRASGPFLRRIGCPRTGSPAWQGHLPVQSAAWPRLPAGR